MEAKVKTQGCVKDAPPTFWIEGRSRSMASMIDVTAKGIGYAEVPEVVFFPPSKTQWYLWRFGEGSTVRISALEDEKPGTPLAEHFNEIAAKLKEIEAERHRDIQAVEIPEEK
jgi:hypothetical protein